MTHAELKGLLAVLETCWPESMIMGSLKVDRIRSLPGDVYWIEAEWTDNRLFERRQSVRWSTNTPASMVPRPISPADEREPD